MNLGSPAAPRLLPNGTLERVETPLAAQLFAALDAALRTSRMKLEELWDQAVGGRAPQQQQQVRGGATPCCIHSAWLVCYNLLLAPDPVLRCAQRVAPGFALGQVTRREERRLMD